MKKFMNIFLMIVISTIFLSGCGKTLKESSPKETATDLFDVVIKDKEFNKTNLRISENEIKYYKNELEDYLVDTIKFNRYFVQEKIKINDKQTKKISKAMMKKLKNIDVEAKKISSDDNYANIEYKLTKVVNANSSIREVIGTSPRLSLDEEDKKDERKLKNNEVDAIISSIKKEPFFKKNNTVVLNLQKQDNFWIPISKTDFTQIFRSMIYI